MAVTDKHPRYEALVDTWVQTRDAVAGSAAIKGKGKTYLPVPDSEDEDGKIVQLASSPRYKSYLKRANYVNFVGRTRSALTGAAFRKDPEYKLPASLEYLVKDATGSGLPLIQLAKDEVGNNLEVGRGGLLADYPRVGRVLSKQEEASMGARARIIPYTAESIINWKTVSINGQIKLSLVVLEESVSVSGDVFSHKTDPQYRVLRLIDGIYNQEVYNKAGDLESGSTPIAGGKYLTEIPFYFFGSRNNDASPDDAPLADMAGNNISHYRNSADYEESVFLCGQPTLALTSDLSAEQWEKLYPDGIRLGSRAALFLGKTGSANLIQAEPNMLAAEAMKAKESNMIQIGARIITDGNTAETAEGARIRFSSENSVLADVVGNVSECIEKAISACALFMRATGEIEYKISTEFYDKSIDPMIISALILLKDRGLVLDEDILARLKESGIVSPDRTIEDLQDLLDNIDPLSEGGDPDKDQETTE